MAGKNLMAPFFRWKIMLVPFIFSRKNICPLFYGKKKSPPLFFPPKKMFAPLSIIPARVSHKLWPVPTGCLFNKPHHILKLVELYGSVPLRPVWVYITYGRKSSLPSQILGDHIKTRFLVNKVISFPLILFPWDSLILADHMISIGAVYWTGSKWDFLLLKDNQIRCQYQVWSDISRNVG